MTHELGEFAEKLEGSGHGAGANLLRAAAKSWEKEGLIPPRLPEQKWATDLLNAEWERHASRYVELGFHKVLELSERKYRESLPRFGPQPESFKGRFDIPRLVETRIDVAKQAELVRIRYLLEGYNVRDWEQDPRGYKTPKLPYVAWMQDGRAYLGKSVASVRRLMATDERGATEFDGIALYIMDHNILEDHFIDLPGTSVESDDAAGLDLWNGGPELNCDWVGGGYSRFGSASCGR
nr:hypothetical protein [uncultured bacterium]